MRTKSIVRWLAASIGLAAGAYASYVAFSWRNFGRQDRPAGGGDELLNRFMPIYEVADHHHTRVAAPAELTLEVACGLDLLRSAVVRTIVAARARILGSRAAPGPGPRGLLDEARALGWVVLAETPGREVVLGAVTKPWEANPVFRSIPPDAFRMFAEPDHVKITWTLRADPIGAGESVFRTETRAMTTDPGAREKFRRYWAFVSPGVLLIRRLSLGPIRREAERRARALSFEQAGT